MLAGIVLLSAVTFCKMSQVWYSRWEQRCRHQLANQFPQWILRGCPANRMRLSAAVDQMCHNGRQF